MKKQIFFLLGILSSGILLSASSLKDALILLSAALLHEAGHLLAALFCGLPIRSFSFSPGGMTMFLDLSFVPYKKEIVLFLAGPAANAFGAAVSFFLLRERFSLSLLYFFFCNMLFLLINLLPIKGLDGYQGLFSFLSFFSSTEKAKRILSPISFAFSLCLFVLGIFLFIQWKNVSLLLFSLIVFSDGQTKKATNLS